MQGLAYVTEPETADLPCSRAATVFNAAEMSSLRWMARQLAPRGMDPEDLLHDAVERALRNLDRFAVGTNLRAWMRTIMTRLVIDQVRGRRRHPTTALDEWGLVAEPLEDAPEEEPWAGLTTSDVRAAADELPETMRATFELFAFEGLPYEEIARRLGIPARTVGSRLHRTRERLRALLLARQARRQAPLPFPPRGQAPLSAAEPA
jgi:RNA polymerase sigma-70 factor (ECF subfamily)